MSWIELVKKYQLNVLPTNSTCWWSWVGYFTNLTQLSPILSLSQMFLIVLLISHRQQLLLLHFSHILQRPPSHDQLWQPTLSSDDHNWRPIPTTTFTQTSPMIYIPTSTFAWTTPTANSRLWQPHTMTTLVTNSDNYLRTSTSKDIL